MSHRKAGEGVIAGLRQEVASGVRAEVSTKDEMVLLFIGPVVAGAALPILAGTVDGAAAWMVEHQILVDTGVAVELPGAGGAGLDVARVGLLAVFLIAMLASGVIVRSKRRDDD